MCFSEDESVYLFCQIEREEPPEVLSTPILTEAGFVDSLPDCMLSCMVEGEIDQVPETSKPRDERAHTCR